MVLFIGLDEGIAILTGIVAGERSSDGTYPKDTVNHLVGKKLHDCAITLKTFSKGKRGHLKKR